MANRLSVDPPPPQWLALEAGPRDTDRFIPIPAGFPKLFRSEIDWDYLTEPQPELGGSRNLLAARQESSVAHRR